MWPEAALVMYQHSTWQQTYLHPFVTDHGALDADSWLCYRASSVAATHLLASEDLPERCAQDFNPVYSGVGFNQTKDGTMYGRTDANSYCEWANKSPTFHTKYC